MWFEFSRKKGRRHRANSRLNGRSFLRVNTSARDRRAASAGLLRAVLIFVGIVGAALLVKAGMDLAAIWFVQDNDLFRIRTREVKCHGNVIKTDHIMDYTSLGSFSNLFAADIAAMRRNLLSTVPRVKSVEISRQLNGTLAVEIWEREAVARLFANNYYMSVDEEGYVLGPAADTGSMPIISGWLPSGLKPGVSLADTPVMNAIEVLTVSGTTPVGRVIPIAQIGILSDKTVQLWLDDGTIAKLAWSGMGERTERSRASLEKKLLRLAENIIEAGRRGDRILEIDMTGEKTFPARCARRD